MQQEPKCSAGDVGSTRCLAALAPPPLGPNLCLTARGESARITDEVEIVVKCELQPWVSVAEVVHRLFGRLAYAHGDASSVLGSAEGSDSA